MTKTPRGYMKYWKVIRQYIKARYKLSQADLDVLLFMYDEGRFTRDRFDEFARVLTWDKVRFQKLMREGWFEVFRHRIKNMKVIYEMTSKGKNLVNEVYRKLNGEEIPMSRVANPMLRRNAKHSEKVYIDMIKEMNEFIRQQRHQTPE